MLPAPSVPPAQRCRPPFSFPESDEESSSAAHRPPPAAWSPAFWEPESRCPFFQRPPMHRLLPQPVRAPGPCCCFPQKSHKYLFPAHSRSDFPYSRRRHRRPSRRWGRKPSQALPVPAEEGRFWQRLQAPSQAAPAFPAARCNIPAPLPFRHNGFLCYGRAPRSPFGHF